MQYQALDMVEVTCISFCTKLVNTLQVRVFLFSIFIETTCISALVSDKFLFLSLVSSWNCIFNFSTIFFAIRHEPLSS